jgi:thiol-disulfide isomerase/thioredoxin
MVILRNCFILLFLFSCETNPKIKNVYPVEKNFDFSHEFTTIDGNSYDLSANNLNSDVTIINFWASWCLPCVQEIPSLNNLKEQFKDSSLKIIAINYGENKKKINQFMDNHKMNFVVLSDENMFSENFFKIIGLPTSFIINKNGKITHEVIGEIEWDSKPLINIIENLLRK